MVGAKPPAVRRRITSPPTTLSSRSSGTASKAWMPASTSSGAPASPGVLVRSGMCKGARIAALLPRGVSPIRMRRSRSASTRSELMPKAALGTNTSSDVVEFVDRAFIGLRELHRAADDGRQHGVEIERGIHRAQHFLQRLQFGDRAGQLGGAFPQGTEVGGTADGDHRLLGEGLQQRNLPV